MAFSIAVYVTFILFMLMEEMDLAKGKAQGAKGKGG
jgi:hypothetical protein